MVAKRGATTPKSKTRKMSEYTEQKLPPGVFPSPFIPRIATGRRRLGRRDSEEKVERAIERKFNHLPADVVNHKLVNGKTLRETFRNEIFILFI